MHCLKSCSFLQYGKILRPNFLKLDHEQHEAQSTESKRKDGHTRCGTSARRETFPCSHRVHRSTRTPTTEQINTRQACRTSCYYTNVKKRLTPPPHYAYILIFEARKIIVLRYSYTKKEDPRSSGQNTMTYTYASRGICRKDSCARV